MTRSDIPPFSIRIFTRKPNISDYTDDRVTKRDRILLAGFGLAFNEVIRDELLSESPGYGSEDTTRINFSLVNTRQLYA